MGLWHGWRIMDIHCRGIGVCGATESQAIEVMAMRLFHVRFTVRRMMCAVASFAILMGVAREVGRLRRLSQGYARRAVLAGREERGWRQALILRIASEADARQRSIALRAKDQDLAAEWAVEASICAEEVVEVRSVLAHFVGLHQKYQRAASRPWDVVAPDPPEPRPKLVWRCVLLPNEPLPPGQRWYAPSEDAERLREMATPR
jgi:hypothetical protein